MKKLLAILASVALVMGAFCLVGCGANDEELIRESLTESLNAYKNMDDEVLSNIASSVEEYGLESLNIDSQEIAVAVLDGFDYSIDDVKVDGKTAVATVTIVSKSSADFEARINDAVESITNEAKASGADQETMTNELAEAMMQAFQDAEIVTETAEIEYTLNGNTWEPVRGENALADLDSIVFAQ